ncbi:multiheme c-type cytochrome [Bythopirellula polymerisocia]|uniref:Hydroxylamine oxidoreductase n=1 Tax=Bythopirellula polymerisocia TaxID=2528003 RepID=A0A5C6CE34_9BACT|nr:multiheme c-type cytochrome [Bythopirellula polymerisocia]TWU21764.1 Hydroxylamine oxidoreductase precursor [Bythopirellula polymerisocia]
MSLKVKQIIIGLLGLLFLLSLVFVQWMEVARKRQEAGLVTHAISIPAKSAACVKCHSESSPGITDHWTGSTHAEKGVGCVECHQAQTGDADAYTHYGELIATIVTPKDCSHCHEEITKEFMASHHAKAGNILASLDNFLAETVEGARVPFNPHSSTPGRDFDIVNGMASVDTGCKQCHGSEIALEGTDGSSITVKDLQPDKNGKPTNLQAVALIKKTNDGRPVLQASSWPNTGIGRLNLDGSLGSCSACHSRHDFSPRRARQPENCGKCHLGPDHPQKEIYEESKHGVAFRDLREKMNLDADEWVLGKDYSQAPTCATCHMSGHSRNGGRITHDPGVRISWTNRPPVSLVMDTDIDGKVITEQDPDDRQKLIHSSWLDKRLEMQQVCLHCHTQNYIDAFYKQYDDFVVNYNEKFAKPGKQLMATLKEQNLLTPKDFDEEIEWTWFYLWHHEGRRARHGASMMAPDYAHWHGMYEVAERFYMELIPQAREIIEHARAEGNEQSAIIVEGVVEGILARPEHEWFEQQKKLAEAAPANTREPVAKDLVEAVESDSDGSAEVNVE